MIKVVKSVQSVCDLPLQIDSTNPEVIEAALRVCNGKAIVNSVNGEDEILDSILPIVSKYGAAVVGLTMDGDGIPKTAKKRVEIAEKIISRCADFGISPDNICIDCLTLTVSTHQKDVFDTLFALREIKEKFRVKTVLGVSNISFGLPSRSIINRAFLGLALSYGLDFAIINPNDSEVMDEIRAWRVLTGNDDFCDDYIKHYSKSQDISSNSAAPCDTSVDLRSSLGRIIEEGISEQAFDITKKLLLEYSPMEIINDIIIPALDTVGSKYEDGSLFLPGLMRSAKSAQNAFSVLRESMDDSSDTSMQKEKIIIATVKGDLHDIGKNIAKVLLQNYGYNVIDLGRDVSPETVVSTAIQEKSRLVGLSSLMTTTLPAMEKTIEMLKSELPSCVVMVGGAVLTADYAEKISADFYVKDAKDSVDVAKKVLSL